MKIFSSYDEIPSSLAPIVLTIGNFDAVHLGHSALLKHARNVAKASHGNFIVLTFLNHPVEVLQRGKVIPRLCTLRHKLKLLESEHVDGVILFEFTAAFAKQTAEEFLLCLKQHLPFQALILGHDACIGSDQRANSPFMYALSQKHHFCLEYVQAYSSDKIIVSSSAIRQAVENGAFTAAERMLGRKFSILTTGIVQDDYTISLNGLDGLCLPPTGTYSVSVKFDEKLIDAIADIQKESEAISIQIQFPNLHKFNNGLLEVFFMLKC